MRQTVPRVLYTNAYTAMFIGVLVALLSHIPFSILWSLAFAFGNFAQVVAIVLAYGYVFGGIPQIILRAIAGYICYRKGVPVEERD